MLKRFSEKIDCTGSKSLAAGRYITLAAHENYLGIEPIFATPFLQIDAGHSWQTEIEEKAGRTGRISIGEKSFRRIEILNIIACACE
jgi:hypothetical protein